MPANGFCLPGVQLNVALIRCLTSAKHRKNRNDISKQSTNLMSQFHQRNLRPAHQFQFAD